MRSGVSPVQAEDARWLASGGAMSDAVSVPEGWEALLPAMADVERERVVLRVGAACGEAWYEGEVPDLG